MYKKTIPYVDYNGEKVSEDCYFNLTKSELIDLNNEIPGGLEELAKKIIQTKDGTKIMEFFKKIVIMSYGEKSPDGKHFYKSPEITHDFLCSPAYDELYFELCTNADKAAEFFNAIIPELPPELKAQAEAKKKELGLTT